MTYLSHKSVSTALYLPAICVTYHPSLWEGGFFICKQPIKFYTVTFSYLAGTFQIAIKYFKFEQYYVYRF